MGLDTSHDCWHGSYGAFCRWRDHLAIAAGYEVNDDGHGFLGRISLNWDGYPENRYLGEGWERETVEDPLVYLLVHSDCDGVIHPEQGRHIAARLEQLLPHLDEGFSGGHISSMRGVTRQFIDGLRRAAEAGEDVDFH